MEARLENITVVLHEPHIPENIGAAARAICNMGISNLVVVNPKNYDLERIQKMATVAAVEIVENIKIYNTLQEALSEFNWVVGTTARTGSHRQTIRDPRQLAEELVDISQNNKIAILFGPEDKGLANRELGYCHTAVTIPTGKCTSLNLAQAVMVICYEIFVAGKDLSPPFTPRLASFYELEGMYEHLKEVLIKIDFIDPKNPDYWFQNIRRFFSRLKLLSREVKIIRGICRQLLWYMETHHRQDQTKAAD